MSKEKDVIWLPKDIVRRELEKTVGKFPIALAIVMYQLDRSDGIHRSMEDYAKIFKWNLESTTNFITEFTSERGFIGTDENGEKLRPIHFIDQAQITQ